MIRCPACSAETADGTVQVFLALRNAGETLWQGTLRCRGLTVGEGPDAPAQVKWRWEAAKYRREYDRAVKSGALVEVIEDDYIAYLRREALKAAQAQEKAQAKKAARQAALEREAALAAQLADARQRKLDTSDDAASVTSALGSGGPD